MQYPTALYCNERQKNPCDDGNHTKYLSATIKLVMHAEEIYLQSNGNRVGQIKVDHLSFRNELPSVQRSS
jgi:hypothetical protein